MNIHAGQTVYTQQKKLYKIKQELKIAGSSDYGVAALQNAAGFGARDSIIL